MRILSLLPSATEIVFALGLGEHLVGVTDECDHPPGAKAKPVVSRSALPANVRTASEIDAAVRASVSTGAPIYRLDTEQIRRLAPDLILTQDLCRVCAVPTGAVSAALDVIGCRPQVVSLDPTDLGAVIADVTRVGRATGTEHRAEAVAGELRERVDVIATRARPLERRRVLALEWGDPPFSGGHWIPEMITLAGGEAVLASAREPSRTLSWRDVEEADADVVVFMPCGYDLDRAVTEGRSLLDRTELAGAQAVFAVNANAYFSRPGPRLVDGLEALAWALHRRVFGAPGQGMVLKLR